MQVVGGRNGSKVRVEELLAAYPVRGSGDHAAGVLGHVFAVVARTPEPVRQEPAFGFTRAALRAPADVRCRGTKRSCDARSPATPRARNADRPAFGAGYDGANVSVLYRELGGKTR